jgi:hypothetical protein
MRRLAPIAQEAFDIGGSETFASDNWREHGDRLMQLMVEAGATHTYATILMWAAEGDEERAAYSSSRMVMSRRLANSLRSGLMRRSRSPLY